MFQTKCLKNEIYSATKTLLLMKREIFYYCFITTFYNTKINKQIKLKLKRTFIVKAFLF